MQESEKIIGDRTYQFKMDSDKKIYFNIKHDLPIPQTLFKYYALTKQNIGALLNNYIFTPHPKQYNDPFDCDPFLVQFDDLGYINRISEMLMDSFSPAPTKEQIQTDINFLFRNLIFSEISCLSFSGSNANQLLWSYYTDNKGFYVEFDYEKFTFPKYGPFPIQYIKELPPLPVSQFKQLIPLIMSTIKQDIWQHEFEWRFIIQQLPENGNFITDEDRKLFYSKKSIVGVGLGIRFLEYSEWNANKTDIKKIEINLQENNSNYLLKKDLLDFLSENKIETKWRVQGREKPFEISFYGGWIEKKSGNTYFFHDTKSK